METSLRAARTFSAREAKTCAIAPNQAETFCVASLEVATTPCLTAGRVRPPALLQPLLVVAFHTSSEP